MKKLFLMLFCVGFLSSCFFLFDDKKDPDEPNIDTGDKTLVVFDNTQGKATAAVFNDHRRRPDDKMADAPAKQLTGDIECTSGNSVAFYFSYLIKLKDIYNVSFSFTPPEVGKDQIWVPVYENKENKITIPKLEDTLSSQDQLLSNDSYLLIQNNSSFPFRLQQGASPIRPENSPSDTVLAGEKALYKIRPGSANYQLLVGADYKPVTPPDGGYKAGILYWYIHNITDVTLDQEIPINLDNIDDTLSRFPPPNIRAAGISQAEIRLTWDAVPGAVGYRVYRGSGASSNYTLINSINNPAATSYTETGFSPNTAYYYRVSTLDINEESDQSNALRASTLPVPVPTGLSATPSGSGTIYLSWDSVSVATAYNIYRAPSSDGPFRLIDNVSFPGYTDSGRTSGYTFYYKVSALMGQWESALSGSVSAKSQ